MPDTDGLSDNPEICHIPARVIAWEEWMCQQGVGGISLHLWTPAVKTMALGISQSAERELNLPHVHEDNCHILRRPSGGGAVVLLDGVLAFGVLADPSVFSDKYAIHEAFDLLTEPVRKAVSACCDLQEEAIIAGISDLAVATPDGVRKFCGCAQMRKKHAVLVHGTILVDADKSLLERYLAWPSQVPDYRQGRSHSDFCINLRELAVDVSVASLSEKIVEITQGYGWVTGYPPLDIPQDCDKIYTFKYSSDEWNILRKRPSL